MSIPINTTLAPEVSYFIDGKLFLQFHNYIYFGNIFFI